MLCYELYWDECLQMVAVSFISLIFSMSLLAQLVYTYLLLLQLQVFAIFIICSGCLARATA